MTNQNRIIIDLPHPNSRNAEAFLNSWEEPFLLQESGTNRYVFRSTISHTIVELLFFNSYSAANSFGIAHFSTSIENSMWGLNGALLFVVSGDNLDKVHSLVGHFAGRE